MTCPDLCTAAKCQELEAKINTLEQALESLIASFETHIQQEIPEAHDYNSNLKIDGSFRSNILNLTVADVTSQNTAEIPIPVDHSHDVTVNISNPNDNLYEFKVSVDDNSDSDVLTLSNQESNLKIDGTFENQRLFLTVADGNSQDTAEIPIPLDHTHDVQVVGNAFRTSDDDFTIAFSVQVDEQEDSAQIPISLAHSHNVTVVGNAYRISADTILFAISVEVDGQEDSTQIPITLDNFEPFVTVDVFPVGNEYVIQVSVNGDSDSDSFLIDIPEMNCDELIDSITECCNRLSTKIDNATDYLVAEIEESENNLNNELFVLRNLLSQEIGDVKGKVEDVEQWITVDISGVTVNNLQCEFKKDKEDNVIPQYAQSIGSQIRYSGTGLQGIHENLQIINANLAAIHSDVCKAVDPIFDIGIDDLYEFCDDSGIKREDFADGNLGQEQYNEAVQAYFDALLGDSKYGYLVNTNQPIGSLVSAPSNWTTNILTDFSLIQSKINQKKICQIKEPEPQDVVTIVASDKDLHRVKTKVLILQFVLLDVYPKRSNTDSYWQMQIPAAKDSYDWTTNFDNLRRIHGNQYAELHFNESYVPVSGWFRDVSAANAFFDAILPLTNATEKNRVMPNHSNPEMNIAVFETRPYRAFIKSINEQGKPICHGQYRPVIEAE